MDKKDYLSIRDAANKMGYTRQYVYKELNNKFKPYLKIIDGEKKLHINVLSEFGNIRRTNVDNQPQKIKEKITGNDVSCDRQLVDDRQKNITDNNSDKITNDAGRYDLQSTVNEIVDILRQQLAEKDRQLTEKDCQLKSLQDELNLQNEHVRKQSDKLVGLIEQVNELQRNNQILLAQTQSQKTIESNTDIETEKEKKGILSWIFKKK
ncbi:hypothetical protein IKR55_00425 [bacterium]|nr:hypothetical protein [bacterium]